MHYINLIMIKKKISNLTNPHELIIYLVFVAYFILGFSIYEDYGFYIDEKFHRTNGFFWLSYIADFFELEKLKLATTAKMSEIQEFTAPDVERWNKYGIIFDLPAAYLEIFFGLDEPLKYFQMRHILVFTYFFIGSFFFYKILLNRFKSQIISLVGFLLFIITPRLFGDSFWNNKDIIFLSFYIISIYYYFSVLDHPSNKNIILLGLFAAISTTVRFAGIFIPLTLVIFWLINFISGRNDLHFSLVFKHVVSYFLFLFIFWPYLWGDPYNGLIGSFNLDMTWGGKLNFLGEYYHTYELPYYYLGFWILVSTPILHLLLFSHGFLTYFKRLIQRFFNIKEKSIYNDLWRSKNEKKDFFIFLNFIFFFTGLSLLNISLYNSWRLTYFLYIFIIYFATLSLYLLFVKYKKKKLFTKILMIFSFVIFTAFIIFRIYIYHPYQSFYFNFLTTQKIKDNLEVDYSGLSGIEFLREVIEREEGNHEVVVSVNSWVPLWYNYDLLNENEQRRIKIVPNDEKAKADYIYSNRIYEVDKRYHKKYNDLTEFKKIKVHKVDNTIIYEIYKKLK
jgi:hypothetical protein